MPRFIHQGTWTDGNGVVVDEGTVTVYLAGTDTLATIYAAETGSAADDSVVESDEFGHFAFWVDVTDYELGQRFKYTLSKTAYKSKDYDDIEIYPDVNGYYVEWWGIVKGTGISTANRTANAVALQAAIDTATAVEAICWLPVGEVEYNTTLLLDESTDIRGSHFRRRSVHSAHTALIYTGTSHGISSDPAIYAVKRLWRIHLEGFTLAANNTSNTGHGLYLHHVIASTFRDIDLETWGGYGVYSDVEPEVQGGVDLNVFDNITVTLSSNGFFFDGFVNIGTGSAVAGSGSNADITLTNCKVHFLLNPDGTPTVTGIGWYYGGYAMRIYNTNPIHKHGEVHGAFDAMHKFDTPYGVTITGGGGEVNGQGNNLHWTVNSDAIQIFGFYAQNLDDNILDESILGSNAYFGHQQPLQAGRWPFNYEALTFYVAAPAANITSYTDMIRAGMGMIALHGSVVWDPGSLDDGVGETKSLTVQGAATGDGVIVHPPYDIADMIATGYVQSANTVEIRLQNESTATHNLTEATWKVTVVKAGGFEVINQFQPFAGSVIGASVRMYGGTHTTGNIKCWPTKNGTEFDTDNLYTTINADTPVHYFGLADKRLHKFIATDRIGLSFKTSATFNGIGVFIVDVWISRDGIGFPTIQPY